MSQGQPQPEAVMLVMKIIAAALIGGVLAFAGFVFFTMAGNAELVPADPDSTLIAILLPFAGIALVMQAVIARLTDRATPRAFTMLRVPPGFEQQVLMQLYLKRMIVRYAILDGAAFFAVFVVMSTRAVLPQMVAAVIVALMLYHFPTAGRVNGWVEARLAAFETGENETR